MRRMTMAVGLAFGLAMIACGSDDDDGGGAGAGGHAGGHAGSAGTGGSARSTATLAAPVVEMVMPMAPAGLHVTWKNVQTDCDEVEGERKSPAAEYSVVFTVPGYVDNSHDGSATDAVEYTYRVRCRKGSDYSPYSNEMSGTP